MKVPEFKPTMIEKDWHAAGDFGGTYAEYERLEKEEFDQRVSKAQSVYLRYYDQFSKLDDDREAISRVRDEMRGDEEFLEVADMVETMTDMQMNWVNAILRSEARRSKRDGMERLAQMRAEKAAARAAELEGMTNFGMF